MPVMSRVVRASASTPISPVGVSALSGIWRQLLGIIFLFSVVLWIYAPALRGQPLWDDAAHITRSGLRSINGLWRIWFEVGATQEYYPVLHSAFWLEYHLWGNSSIGYHLVNVFLHTMNCLLLGRLIRRLRSEGSAKGDFLGVEWLAALLFAVHPVCVESVAWITEQKNTLSMFFYLLAAYLYLDFAERRTIGTYSLSLACFLLALGAKTATVVLPPALLVLLWWRQGSLAWKRDILPLFTWFVAAFAAGTITIWHEGNYVGAELVIETLTLPEKALLAGRIIWFYILKLIWPVEITFFYPRWDVASESSRWVVYLLGTVVNTIALWLIRKRYPWALTAWLLYLGSLFPVLGFIKVFGFSFSYVADHFQYLAIPVFCAAAAAGLQKLSINTLLPRWVGYTLCAILVSLLARLSREQSSLYVSDEVLFQANVTSNPTSWMGHHILATRAAERPSSRSEAIMHFREAIRLKSNNADSMAALAALLVREPGQQREALSYFTEAVKLRPTFAEAHNGLANELVDIPGRLNEAIAHYETALRLRPKFGLARANLAQALARVPGRQQEALICFEEALRIMPDYVPTYFHLANFLSAMPGRQSEALEHYSTALRLQPNLVEARVRLAGLLVQLNRTNEGLAQYQLALQQAPTNQAAWIHYDVAIRLEGKIEYSSVAEMHVREFLRLEPMHLDGINLLGIILARQNRATEARECWNQALQIKPDFEPALNNLRLLVQPNAR